MNPYEILYLTAPFLVLFSSIEVFWLGFYLKSRGSKERVRKFFPIWITILIVILLLNIGFIWEDFFNMRGLYKVFELGAVIVFFGAAVSTRWKILSGGGAVEGDEELRPLVEMRTREVKVARDQLEEYSKSLEKMVEGRTKELKENVVELEAARTALINMMDDVEAANRFLRKSLERLEEVDRMKDQLLSNVSHELRTPITIVKSGLELILDDGVSGEQEKLIAMGKGNLNRLDALVGDLLYFSKGGRDIPEGEIETLSLKDVIEASVNNMSHLAKVNNISVSVSVGRNIPPLEASRSRLIQVFTNLIGNAIKFNKEKGSIKIKASYKKGDDMVSVSVQDTGIGIPTEQLPRVFDRFYQGDGSTSRKYSGTGLGLAITKSIIEAHGGRIWVESQLGEGTTFQMTLPIKRKKKYIVTLPLGEKEKWQR